MCVSHIKKNLFYQEDTVIDKIHLVGDIYMKGDYYFKG